MSSPPTIPFDPRECLAHTSRRPGVYRMLNEQGDILYVGKAGNLHKRLASYFRTDPGSPKVRSLLAQIAAVETTVTNTEAEALLLEHTLIKQHRPRYNVLLRDDKSYPFIYVSTEDQYPRLTFHRGARREPGKFVGPYPSASSVKSTLALVQKLFRVRQCEDSYFANRTRPCLQYQIARCSAPCVGLVSEGDYQRDVERTLMLLDGRDQEVVSELVGEMEAAAAALDFERAARRRDQIADLKRVTERQYVAQQRGNIDAIAVAIRGGVACVQVFFIRNGVNLGNKAFFPSLPADTAEGEVLYGFLTQFYLAHDVPGELLLSHEPDDAILLGEVLSQRAGQMVALSTRLRGQRLRWREMAEQNAALALSARLASRAGMAARLDDLRRMLDLDELPSRMECFDISHTRGELPVASCVVFGAEGAIKSEYRRFNITDVTPGDDYAAMQQALERRYTRLLKESRPLPDVLFIDGGKGQLSRAERVMRDLQLQSICLVGVAKGPERRPGEETLVLSASGEELHPGHQSPGLHLVQQIRDEAHRFAIAGHRTQRGRQRSRSSLEQIDGLGPKRRRALLTHFGGMQGIQRAGVEDLARVPGISRSLAQRVYDVFHADVLADTHHDRQV
jgi:excinuclease ABC subunit C